MEGYKGRAYMGRLRRDISIRWLCGRGGACVMTLGTPTNRKRMSRKESRRNVYTRPTSRPYNPPGAFRRLSVPH